ncbi:MAG TPA: ATP-binding protein [Ktedonobacteraceae bacterium]|nr:ATP-binding protein [Ktedonobacteraceae bacterium]
MERQIQFELKVAAPRATEMAERLCGLANAQGGMVIIGVKDSSYEIVGVPDSRIGETLDVILRAARQMIKPELVLDPPEPEIYTLSGKNVVIVTVKPSHGPVYQAHGIYWVRRGTHTISLSLAELLEMANDRGMIDWEHQAARNATMEDIDFEKVKKYLRQRSTGNRRDSHFKNIERVLLGMECAAKKADGDVVPTNAGLLFFGAYPQVHIPQSDVACVLFRETVGASRYADRRIITGTLQELIDGAELFLSRYIAVGARVEGFKRIDIPEYSLEVLREAVINAVVHRDYSKRGESVRVFCYPDRVEIHSPGLLLPGITVEQMERGEVQSKLRNPTLANLLKDIPGYMERLGSGIRFMLDETKRLELPAPQFREMNEFIVTFQKAPALLSPQEQPAYKGTLWEEVENVPPEILSQSQTDQCERRLTKAVEYVQTYGFITNSIYRQLTGVSDRTAHRDLETLVERGRFKGTGQRAARRYVLA